MISELGYIHWYNGELADAESTFRSVFETSLSNHLQYWVLASIYCDMGEHDKVLKCLQKEKNPYSQLFIRSRYAYSIGNEDEAKVLLKEFRDIPDNDYRKEVVSTLEQHYFAIAQLCAYMGEVDKAFFFLDKA